MDKSVKEQEKNKDCKKELQTSITTTNNTTSTTSITTSTSPTAQPLENVSPHDDDSITTSTESSDTFETWTLVVDKKNNDLERVDILTHTEGEDNDEEVEEEHEVEKASLDHKVVQGNFLHDVDVNTDDLSDGISIISESESNGRLSPHPYLRDHLQDLNLKFATTPQDDEDVLYKPKDGSVIQRSFSIPVKVPTEEQQLRQRRPVSSLANVSQENEEEEDKNKAVQMAACQTLAELNYIPPLVKRGLQGIFYIGVALAILALIGRMRNPAWDSSNPSSAELQQKVNDMELQNNLMRAEIDLLNKQVKYLNTLNDPQQHQQYQKKSDKYSKGQYEQPPYEGGKRFKAWSGNGDSLRPVEITKEDLKRPYKCPDGSFREFAGMCVENHQNEPNIVEQFEQVMDDFKQQSETMQAFEKVAQDLHGLTENPFDHVQQILSEQQEPDVKTRQHLDKQSNEFLKNKPIYQAATEGSTQQQEFDGITTPSPKQGEEYQQHRDQKSAQERRKEYGKSKERYDNKHGFEATKPNHDKNHNKSFEKQSKETFDKFKYQNKEGKQHKHREGYESDEDDDDDSKERFNKRDRNDSKEHFQKRGERNNSKERRHNPHKHDDDVKDNSKERYSKRFKDNSSKERFNKDKSAPNPPHGSGEWQEQYMKHREDARKQNEHKYSGENKNWFMKRGDGREHKRNADVRYR